MKTKRKETKKVKSFSDEERAAMQERFKELNAKNDGESLVLEKISQMPEPDRSMAKRIHSIIMKNALELTPRTWYGMPAYSKDGNVICFFQNASKFKARYQILGFNDKANLDDGNMWPASFAINKLTKAEEKKIAALVKKAVS